MKAWRAYKRERNRPDHLHNLQCGQEGGLGMSLPTVGYVYRAMDWVAAKQFCLVHT